MLRALGRPYVEFWRAVAAVVREMPRAFVEIATLRSVRAAWRHDRAHLLGTAFWVAFWYAYAMWVLFTWLPR